jgi:Bacteriocin-protection, YdeI or OmpD-Associated/Domain of unknown function (DUF1905)
MEFSFQAIIEPSEPIFQSAHVVVPEEIAHSLINQKIRRLVGTVASYPFQLALQYNRKLDFHFILTGTAFRKAAKIEIGQTVAIYLKPDPNPDAVILPEEWEEYLAQDEEAHSIWNELTPSTQRSLSMYISTAKLIETRIKRALDLGKKLKQRDLDYFRKKNNR